MDDAAAHDTTGDGRDPDPATGDAPMGPFLGAREGPTPWLRGGHEARAVGEGAGQAAALLAPPAPRGPGVGGGLGTALLVGAARVRGPANAARERGVAQPHVLPRVTRFLAAIIALGLRWSLGALAAPCGPSVAQRGEGAAGVGAAAGRRAGGLGSAVGTTRAAASAAVTPRRWAHAGKDRRGVSPQARRVACSTPHRTCIHGWAWRWSIPHRRPCTTWRGEVCRSARRHHRRASGVGSGPFGEVGYRRAVRGGPAKRRRALGAGKAAANGGTKRRHSSRVRRGTSSPSRGRGWRSVHRQCPMVVAAFRWRPRRASIGECSIVARSSPCSALYLVDFTRGIFC
jgi:hypothetical protein